MPIGAAIRCIPDAWMMAVAYALKPIAWPILVVVRKFKERRIQKKRRKEARRQKQEDQGTAAPASADDKPARQHLRWVNKMLGRNDEHGRKPDIALTAVGRVTRNPGILAGDEEDDISSPVDLLAAVEASKHNADGVIPGLRIHPETPKEDPILVMPPTLSEALARRNVSSATVPV